MANNTTISNAAALAACNAIVDLIDVGGTGKLRIYSGTQPTNPDVAIGSQVLLAELTLSSPAFGNAADLNPGARATANAITSDTSANATGTATWFRVVNQAGTAIIDGSVGTSGADLNIATTSIVSGATVSVSSWTVTMRET